MTQNVDQEQNVAMVVTKVVHVRFSIPANFIVMIVSKMLLWVLGVVPVDKWEALEQSHQVGIIFHVVMDAN